MKKTLKEFKEELIKEIDTNHICGRECGVGNKPAYIEYLEIIRIIKGLSENHRKIK